MVTVEYIAMSAREAWLTHGTAMAHAFLMAVGETVPVRPADDAPTRTLRPRRRIRKRHLLDCFENRESPMDGRANG